MATIGQPSTGSEGQASLISPTICPPTSKHEPQLSHPRQLKEPRGLLVVDDTEREIVRGFLYQARAYGIAERRVRWQQSRATPAMENPISDYQNTICLLQSRKRCPEGPPDLVPAPLARRPRLDRPTRTPQSRRDIATREPCSSLAKPPNVSGSHSASSTQVQCPQDIGWASTLDYTPPVVILPPDALKVMKIGVKTLSMLDVRELPNSDKLHPSEAVAASILRLTPNQYLTAKRRIFQAWFEAKRDERPWNKTAAQTVCNIDVKKTSALWVAFQSSGLFDERYMERHL